MQFSCLYEEHKNKFNIPNDFISSTPILSIIGSIELFRFVQKSYRTVGIYPSEQIQNHLLKCALLLIFSAQILVLIVASAVTVPQSTYKIALGFYLSTTTLVTIFFYIFSILNSTNIFELIEQFENFIEHSKYKNFTKLLIYFQKTVAKILEYRKTFRKYGSFKKIQTNIL